MFLIIRLLTNNHATQKPVAIKVFKNQNRNLLKY